MKLILTADVDHLGAVGDTVEVKDGYGRNFLLPRGLAIAASRGAEKQADEIRRARETKTVRDREHATEIKTAIEALGPVSLPVKTAADSGKLFGSVGAKEIVDALRRSTFDGILLGEQFARHDTILENGRKAFVGLVAKVHDALEPEQRERLADLLERGPRFGF